MADPSLGCLPTGAWGGEELRKEENRRRQSPGGPERRGWSAVPCSSRGDDLEADGGVDTRSREWDLGVWVAPSEHFREEEQRRGSC